LSAPYQSYDNKSKFWALSRKSCVARGGDESEVVLSTTFMFYQLVPAKKNDRQHVGTIPGVFIHIHTAAVSKVKKLCGVSHHNEVASQVLQHIYHDTKKVLVCRHA